jgi:NCS1 family nucleobase:cation symporter-1
VAVLLAWIPPPVPFAYLYWYQNVFPLYLTVPVWISCGILYIVFAKIFCRVPATANSIAT